VESRVQRDHHRLFQEQDPADDPRRPSFQDADDPPLEPGAGPAGAGRLRRGARAGVEELDRHPVAVGGVAEIGGADVHVAAGVAVGIRDDEAEPAPVALQFTRDQAGPTADGVVVFLDADQHAVGLEFAHGRAERLAVLRAGIEPLGQLLPGHVLPVELVENPQQIVFHGHGGWASSGEMGRRLGSPNQYSGGRCKIQGG